MYLFVYQHLQGAGRAEYLQLQRIIKTVPSEKKKRKTGQQLESLGKAKVANRSKTCGVPF